MDPHGVTVEVDVQRNELVQPIKQHAKSTPKHTNLVIVSGALIAESDTPAEKEDINAFVDQMRRFNQ